MAEEKEEYQIEGLSCSSCGLKIEKEAQKIEGLKNVELNFATSTINVLGDSHKVSNLEKELQKISNRIETGVKITKKSNDGNSKALKVISLKEYLWIKKDLIIGAIIFFFALGISYTNYFSANFWDNLILVFYLSAYLLIGWPVLKAAFRNIGRGQIFDENFLMTIATFGAFAINEYPEAVAVMLFYMIGELFQERAVNDSRRSIKDLMDIKAEYANLIKDDAIVQVKPEEIKVGEEIVVKAGEKIPLDGKVISGNSAVETSALTGESLPREVESGDDVLSGMVNLNQLLTIKVSKEYNQSTVKKILDLVENASSKKAKTEKFITKFARYYTPFVVGIAFLVAVLPPLLTGAAFNTWFYRALIFLVVSCPCALVVSIPLGFFGGIGLASKNGILVKGGNYLEALNSVDKIVFDKTGTLTKGSFEVTEVKSFSNYSENELLKLAAEIEQFSNHPIAQSIIEAADGYQNHSSDSVYKEISGAGIKAQLNGKTYLAGNKRLMENNGIKLEFDEANATVVYLAEAGNYLGYILISDQIKADSFEAIKKLKAMNIKNITMLTGDNNASAKEVASNLGIDHYYAELLPDQKIEKIESLLEKDKKLAFVGDGINDAPVLARSDLGIAMGGLGSDAAIEAADIVLMTDEPSKIAAALEIAKKTKRLVWQNIVMALSIKAVVMILSVFGLASMWAAVFADVGVALMALFNVMRILKS
ncbi:cadmium-translocating P-type ATPase [Halanaerobium sp. Z-7514]|uniref:Cd(2+)-exporting ATPase n=1 Tax=Halanaerobium polyolivorans TaxID=2886943 RepID=A0AAW4WZ85_9FIRM|nr:heavy metal translocating P-type ATPase [Halanaerobium polyolivorans]MCC3144189.1 cadmium-translocating P-type ATPase [Halanaerobium polyolivorans]